MKKVILLALLFPSFANAQIVQDFESGLDDKWVQSTEGHWAADTAGAILGLYSLHHCFDNPEAGTDQAGIRISDMHPSEGLTRWSFSIKYGYEPSSSNKWAVLLMSDKQPGQIFPGVNTCGFALGVNLEGTDDTLRLYKLDGSSMSVVVACSVNWQSECVNKIVIIVVERAAAGEWTIDVSDADHHVISHDSGHDPELSGAEWFCISYSYSSTKDRLLWLDDLSVEGVFYEDITAPRVTECIPASLNSVVITLNEVPAATVIVPGNFFLNSAGSVAQSVKALTAFSYEITFSDLPVNKVKNTLIIKKLCDTGNNCAIDTNIPFTPVWPEPGDVLITEIMADPEPSVSLPECEYIELTNRSDYSFDMKGWELDCGTHKTYLPGREISAGQVLIICSDEDTALFSKYGYVTGIPQFPSLPDDSEMIVLRDSYGKMIHGVEYSSDWYEDGIKAAGGWSIEIVDTDYPFYFTDNWKASASRKGGTPGAINSIAAKNPDLSFMGIINVFPEDSITIMLELSDPVINYQALPGKIRIDGENPAGLDPADPLLRKFRLIPADYLRKDHEYSLTVAGDLADFAGNQIIRGKYDFGMPELCSAGDILFNEILFDPLPGDPDYIEFYNSSTKIIDASRLLLTSVSLTNGESPDPDPVSDIHYCLMPGSYYAITTDAGKVCERYFSAVPSRIFMVSTLPSMPDDAGHLMLYNRELDLVDDMEYSSSMHYSLLSGHEGISLEKTYPRGNSGNSVNWHSAAETAGWGTPGGINSVFSPDTELTEDVVFSSTRITPDNDGYEDLLTINFTFRGNGNVVSVRIFDEAGNFVRTLAENFLVGAGGSLVWDGTVDDGSPASTGIYILLITSFDESGKTGRWKKICTVLRRS